MKIQESAVSLSASHEASSTRSVQIEAAQGFRGFRQMFESLAQDPVGPPERSAQAEVLRKKVQQMLESLVATIMAAIDGRACRKKLAASDLFDRNAPGASPALPAAAGPRGGEIVWQQRITEKVCESESTQVCGRGWVKTADGREIGFEFSLSMQRAYSRETQYEESGRITLQDPLVLNYPGKACELTDACQAFDLDSDGVEDWIPGLGADSFFLVFDRNGNGRADDGSELFGVKSGNGFADLAKLDQDGNGWIDAGDDAFARLALWSGTQFMSLGAAGIGALHTAAVDAPFSLKNRDNELLGQIRSAGVYLTEDGQAGLLQQVDLAVSAVPDRQQQPDKGQQLAA